MDVPPQTTPPHERPRVLVVGWISGMHMVRWVDLLAPLDWDIHVVSGAGEEEAHPELGGSVELHALPFDPDEPGSAPQRLAAFIERLQPDVVHTHELQHAGYLTLDARRFVRGRFPTWVATTWGSDLAFYGRVERHRLRLQRLMLAIDVLGHECHRDVGLARAFGFRGRALHVSPVGGGFDLDALAPLRSPGPTSARRTIALKGYDGWVYRGVGAVEAIDRCLGSIDGTPVDRLAVYLPNPSTVARAEELCARHGLALDLLERVPHAEIMRTHGHSRASLALTETDGISTSFLEALVMGSFPVQSFGGCAGEWARDGEGALFVDPDDVDGAARALRRALTDDALVDRAAAVNATTAARHLERRHVNAVALRAYEEVVHAARARRRELAGSAP
jgi:glycosyltransferase involved in cell wall biosynthesis